MTSIDRAAAAVAAGEPPADNRVSSTGELGSRLRQLRRSRGVSLADVAEGTGISPSFLSMVEKGKSDITISRLMRLVHWFEVSVSDLVQEPNPSPVQIVRADGRRSLRLADEKISIQMLTSGRPPRDDARHQRLRRRRRDGRPDAPRRRGIRPRHRGLRGADGRERRADRLGGRRQCVLPIGRPAFVPERRYGVARFFGVTTPPNL